MIDTVLISSIFHPRKENSLHKKDGWKKITTESAEGKRIRLVNNSKVARITYYPLDEKIFLEASLPKAVFGENVTELNESSYDESLEKVKNYVETVTDTGVIPLKLWSAHKIDTAKNFKVDSVAEYLDYFSKIPLKYSGFPISFQNKTISWRSKTEGLKFYDKEAECRNKIARDILRMELRIQHQKHFRKILNRHKTDTVSLQDFTFDFLKKKLNEKLKLFFGSTEPVKKSMMDDFFGSMSARQAFSLIGFIEAIENKKFPIDIPKSTYNRYLSKIKKINYGSDIKPLTIK